VKSAQKAADAAANNETMQSAIDGNRIASLRNKSASSFGERLIAFNYRLDTSRWTGIHLLQSRAAAPIAPEVRQGVIRIIDRAHP
jgi:hypothetical protein